jgi:two-component system LytT family response regulator
MTTCIIIDDEQYCIDSLRLKLEDYQDRLKLVGYTTDAFASVDMIKQLRPNLVFLDINLGTTNAFELLEKWPQPHPKIIFTTAYDHFAIKAFRYNAIDYLLKPVDSMELEEALNKVLVQDLLLPQLEQMKQTVDYLNRKTSGLQKIALPTLSGFELVALQDLVRLEAASNYTHFYLNNGSKITTSKTLKEYEEMLEDEQAFVRIHQSHIINLAYVKNFTRGRTPVVTLSNGQQLDVSATRRDLFDDKFKRYFKMK